MIRQICHCEKCGASSADVLVSVYNDFDGQAGELICDDCVFAEAVACDKRVCVVMPARPEGYYHMPIGTFD